MLNELSLEPCLKDDSIKRKEFNTLILKVFIRNLIRLNNSNLNFNIHKPM
jgi:hypothetical protein